MSIEARYTTDPRRIRILQRNYDLGVEREKLPRAEREAEDVKILRVTRKDVARLHVKGLTARMKILDAKNRRSRRSRRATTEEEDESDDEDRN